MASNAIRTGVEQGEEKIPPRIPARKAPINPRFLLLEIKLIEGMKLNTSQVCKAINTISTPRMIYHTGDDVPISFPAEVATIPSVTNVTGFTKESVTQTTATLKWNKNTTATGYIVEQYKGGKWTQIAKTTSNSTLTCTAKGLKANTTYTFRIRAYKTSDSSTKYSDYVRAAVTTAK